MLHFKNNIAALAAVAAVGSAVRDELLAMEMHHAIAALAGANMNFYLVCEHNDVIINDPSALFPSAGTSPKSAGRKTPNPESMRIWGRPGGGTMEFHMNKPFHTLTLSLALFALVLPLSTPRVLTPGLPRFQEASPALEPNPVTPADLIEAVNTLRLANGLNALNAHPVLMQVAQTEANGIAYGAPGHWRPEGLTLGQWRSLHLR